MDDQVLSTLRELLKWTKIQAIPSVKASLQSAMPKAEQRKVYQQLDGIQTQQQIGKALGMSQPTVSKMVSAWLRAGIVEEKSPGKYIRSFDLEELGIDQEE
jgi:DNA-binding transcriptional regulator LsrR (DeoR family)